MTKKITKLTSPNAPALTVAKKGAPKRENLAFMNKNP